MSQAGPSPSSETPSTGSTAPAVRTGDAAPAPFVAATQVRPSRNEPWWRRHLRLIIVLSLVFGSILAFGSYAYRRITERPEPRPEYWDAQMHAAFPLSDKAASRTEIINVLTSRPFESLPEVAAIPNLDLLRDVLSAEVETEGARAAFAAMSSAEFIDSRRALDGLLHRPWRLFRTINEAGDSSSYAPTRAWARWLVAHSRYLRTHGQGNAAAEEWIRVFQLGERLTDQPTTIGILVRMAIDALVASQVQEAALDPDLDIWRPEVYAALRAFQQPAEDPARLLRLVRLRELNMLEHVYTPSGSLDVSEQVGFYYGGFVGGRPSRVWNVTSFLFDDHRTMRLKLEKHFDSLGGCFDAATLNKRLAGIKPLGPVQGLRSPPLEDRVLILYWRGRTTVEASLTMLAIAKFQREHHRFPATLQELVPGWLDRVPVDYEDGNPLRYRPDPDEEAGYLLYSIGENGVDDGGSSGPYSNGFRADLKLDKVFSRGEGI